ncbi:hypothetical protein COJ48_18330 [Bacillus cereus]|uniref:DUF5592 family protein n=1 Tax=Bacillus paramycoides TaxID=2026194 RepID=UPI000BF25270|nr:DUF5592 family protein [Bacillus paramycoides]NWK72620.1 hypothetical protein [Bacillus paramycoides]PFM62732.1 hypothetical protein COJ48_18330 [Bacillus cereus]PGP88763.1 hypothetical protein CN997_02515 [Bacillus cereus]
MKMKRNPKNTKQEIKLMFFYLFDLGIIAGIVIFASYLSKILLLGAVAKISLYIVAAVFGVFLCIKPFSSPTNRNMKVILDMVKMDRRKFDAIELKEFKSITETQQNSRSRKRVG